MRGKFITLEGLEGSGKSTQIAVLEQELGARGVPVLVTREPGGTPLAERLREIVLSPGPERISSIGELLIMFAARAVHLENLIRPALEQGTWVLCDRFTDASYAYQGAGRGVSEELIATLEKQVQGPLRPDVTFLLDVPARIGLERAAARRGARAPDRFELEDLAFFERVRSRFLELARRHPERIRIVDAERSPAEVSAKLLEQLDALLRESSAPIGRRPS
jgi:dTMP kinase